MVEGLEAEHIDLLAELMKAPYGIILFAGPADSGKTTTMYAALDAINKENVDIVAVDDQPAYTVPGVRHISVDVAKGATLASAVRSSLKHRSDVIVIGEIRDNETAQSAVQAALTGHLVLATLQADDISQACVKLIALGIAPFLVAASLIGVLFQKLAKKVCMHCSESYIPGQDEILTLEIEDYAWTRQGFYKGKGCDVCRGSGYKGFIGIFDIIAVSQGLQSMIFQAASADKIRSFTEECKLDTLRQDCLRKLFAGLTTSEEVLRLT